MKQKQCFYLTHVLAVNNPWNFQQWLHHARLLVHLANFPAPAFLQGRKYCLVQAGEQQEKQSLALSHHFKSVVETNKCQENPSPLFQPRGKSYFCSDISSSLRPIDCSIQFIFTSFVALQFAKESRVNNNFHLNHFSAVDIKDIDGWK